MRKLIAFALAALLAGCASQAELAAQQEREVDRMVNVYGPGCEKLGFPRNTDLWRDCVLRLATKDSLDHQRFPSVINCFGGAGFAQCTSF